MKRKFWAVMMITVLTFGALALTACNGGGRAELAVPRESKYIDVNGVTIHYETCGSGQPFILLHGNGEDLTIFDGLVDRLASDYTVYALDTRGHGGSSAVEEFHYSDMAEDVAQFITALGLEKPLLYGFSDGGIVGLTLAFTHHDMLDKLMISGANTNPDGLKGYFTLGSRFVRLFKKGSDRALLDLMLNEPNISDNELMRIRVPVLVLAGKRDIVKEENTRHIAECIENSTLKIVPRESHGSYVEDGAMIYGILTEYLNSFEA